MDLGEELRVCCGMLRRTSPTLLAAMSMTVPLDEARDASAATVLRLAERIAREHGLQVTAEVDAREITLRLSRGA